MSFAAVAWPVPRAWASRQKNPITLPAAVVVGAAWIGLALFGHELHQGLSDEHHGPASFVSPVVRAAAWALMIVAMMGPVVLSAVTFLRANTLSWRRGRATVQFLLVYVLMWMTVAVPAWMLEAEVNRVDSPYRPVVAAGALLVAAGWQTTGLKHLALDDCHRPHTLPPRGWRAMKGVGSFAVRHAWACIRTCAPLMLAVAVAAASIPAAHLPIMAAAAGGMVFERRSRHPRKAARMVAIALVITATACLLLAGGSD
ncbi:DUF2182 domain-containing protein [Rhodococcus sp. NPDC060086]|uniref:copper chaperone n=1 Tax=Rhodococcus sp. NPDC060086 TaxID=3347055 RepID=UPI00364F18D0